MTGGRLLSGLMFLVLSLVWTAAGAAEVGYINILNGVEPAKAFVVERQGRSITPKGVYTNLEEGDLVKPSAEALLLFTPVDTACETVEIQGDFTATACPKVEGGLKDMAYDFVASEFMAAPEASVGVFATRGAGDKRVYSLPPQALRLFVESPSLADSLKKTPFIALVGSKTEAEALIVGQSPVTLLSPGQAKGRQFKLPSEGAALRQALLSRINYKTMSNLASPGSWPDFEWTTNIYTEAANGTLDFDNRKWNLVQSVKADQQPKPISVKDPCVLTFKLANRSSKPYYAYLFNYTSDGLLLPLLPSPEAPQVSNLIAAGAEVTLSHIFLELGEPQENLRLIVSENQLEMSQFNQESLDSPTDEKTKPNRLRPAPEKSWHTLSIYFSME